jgi:hypothetical protein
MKRPKKRLSRRERCGICDRIIRAGEERNYMEIDDESFPIHVDCLEVFDEPDTERFASRNARPS